MSFPWCQGRFLHADGEMLHCLTKSALMTLIELKEAPAVDSSNVLSHMRVRKKVVIVDGMHGRATVTWLTRCHNNLCSSWWHFTEKVLQKYFENDELHLVFDRYNFPLFLKPATQARRQSEQHPVYYRVTDSTHLAKVPMKRFLLSHERTKMELTEYRSISKGDPKIRRHEKECYCGLGLLLSRNSHWCHAPEKQPRRGRHQHHSPRCWCCFWWCNWNYHPLTRYRCFCPVLEISTALQQCPVCHCNWTERPID